MEYLAKFHDRIVQTQIKVVRHLFSNIQLLKVGI
jgi:hypothetical protein